MPLRVICAVVVASTAVVACGYPPLDAVCTGAMQPPGCTSGPGDAGGAGGETGGEAGCSGVTATRITPSIALLLDRSGSMSDGFDGGSTTTGPTKYAGMRDALIGTQGVVTRLQQQVYFGAALYSDETPCPTLHSVARARDNLQQIASLFAQQAPGGATPTPPSIDLVVRDFLMNPPPLGSPPLIVLATDGLPNQCGNSTVDTQPQSVAAAANAYASGIPLLVVAVGVVTGTTAAHLQAMANAGRGVRSGEPEAPYYPGSTPAQLVAAFQDAIGATVCDLALGARVDPTSAQRATVTLDGRTLSYGVDWTLDASGSTLHLVGNACTALKGASNPVITTTFGCNP